tara:strand:- start:295 stop:1002 length:708 start_codon:yes stop_codon:yes gene_type:complete
MSNKNKETIRNNVDDLGIQIEEDNRSDFVKELQNGMFEYQLSLPKFLEIDYGEGSGFTNYKGVELVSINFVDKRKKLPTEVKEWILEKYFIHSIENNEKLEEYVFDYMCSDRIDILNHNQINRNGNRIDEDRYIWKIKCSNFVYDSSIRDYYKPTELKKLVQSVTIHIDTNTPYWYGWKNDDDTPSKRLIDDELKKVDKGYNQFINDYSYEYESKRKFTYEDGEWVECGEIEEVV